MDPTRLLWLEVLWGLKLQFRSFVTVWRSDLGAVGVMLEAGRQLQPIPSNGSSREWPWTHCWHWAARLRVRLGQIMGLLWEEVSPFSSQLPLFLKIIKHDLRKRQQQKALRLVFSLCKAADGSLFFPLSSHLFCSVSRQETSGFEKLHL